MKWIALMWAAGLQVVYTNADLERMSDRVHETGVTNRPAVAAGEPEEPENRSAEKRYWQREVRKVRDRVRRLRERITTLDEKIEKRSRLQGVLPLSDPQLDAWRASVRELRDQIVELESDLYRRARREGIPPGWLR